MQTFLIMLKLKCITSFTCHAYPNPNSNIKGFYLTYFRVIKLEVHTSVYTVVTIVDSALSVEQVSVTLTPSSANMSA
mgnify:CR=1 FL=1